MRIQDWREEAGLSQYKLAKNAGLTTKGLRDLEEKESGETRVSTLIKLAAPIAEKTGEPIDVIACGLFMSIFSANAEGNGT